MPLMLKLLIGWPRRRKDRGFTLLEALVVVALLGILVSLAAPAMMSLQTRHQLEAQAQAFLNSLVLARSEALRRQQRISLCAQAAESSCDVNGQWQQGWLVFVDENSNGKRETQEALIEVRAALPPSVRLAVTSSVRAYFSYEAEGRSMSINGAFMAGSWRFCHTSLTQGWQVVSNALGRPRIEKYTPKSCP